MRIQQTLSDRSIEAITALFNREDWKAIPVVDSKEVSLPVTRGESQGRMFVAFRLQNQLALITQSKTGRPKWVLSNGKLFDPSLTQDVEIINSRGLIQQPAFSQLKNCIDVFMKMYGPNRTILGSIFSVVESIFGDD